MPGMPERAQAPKEGSVQIRLEPLETTESKRQLRDQIEGELTPSTRAVLELSPHVKGELVDADAHQPLDRELVILFWRTWTDTTRHPALLRLHMVVSALVGAASAIIFNNVPQDLAGLQNRAGFIFFTLTFSRLRASRRLIFSSRRGPCLPESSEGATIGWARTSSPSLL